MRAARLGMRHEACRPLSQPVPIAPSSCLAVVLYRLCFASEQIVDVDNRGIVVRGVRTDSAV